MAGIGGFARDESGFTHGRAATEEVWLPLAREALSRVAGAPHAVVTQADFAEEIQARSGIRANGALSKWLGHFLERMAREGRANGDPPLPALVVADDNGKVGPAYDAVLLALGLAPADTGRERERLAAEHRIECYRWAGAPTPAGGWAPRQSLRSGRERSPRRTSNTRSVAAARASAPPEPAATCPTCFMQLPATGVCDYCA
ncbi:MAG: hypothetical protein V9G19_21495 [Tetrasphaera sp.]